MATATILTVAAVRMPRVRRRLSRAGYAVAGDHTPVRVTRNGTTVEVSAVDPATLPAATAGAARQLLGLAPRHALRCASERPAGWEAVLDVARAVAASVPLAVLADADGVVHLVHPRDGLVEPPPGGRAGTGEILRRLLGGR